MVHRVNFTLYTIGWCMVHRVNFTLSEKYDPNTRCTIARDCDGNVHQFLAHGHNCFKIQTTCTVIALEFYPYHVPKISLLPMGKKFM